MRNEGIGQFHWRREGRGVFIMMCNLVNSRAVLLNSGSVTWSLGMGRAGREGGIVFLLCGPCVISCVATKLGVGV